MNESSTASLPGAEQIRNLRAAGRAARQTRRLLDASRAIFTGNAALLICLPATILVMCDPNQPGNWFPWVWSAATLGLVAWTIVSFRLVLRLRSASGVKVVDWYEANLDKIRKHPLRHLIP